MRQNLFIALEGIDGSGKSTQANLLAQKLGEEGHKIYSTFEPTKRQVGAMIRRLLIGEMKADERTIAGLFVADRLDHLLNNEDGLVMQMNDGFTVVTDRYYFSSYAYHGVHTNIHWVIAANEMAARILRPDINIFIDVSPEVAMQRVQKNRGTTELYETLENLQQVRAKYYEAFDLLRHKEKIVIINGDQPVEIIAEDIYKAVRAVVPAAEMGEST